MMNLRQASRDDLIQAVMAQHDQIADLERHLAELFAFVADPAGSATNNATERNRPPLVVSRKISGGTRSALGTATKMALASLFGTWRPQVLSPLDQCRQLLTAPQA